MNPARNRVSVAFVAGLTFGAGLVFAEMVNPARVLAFLDLFGAFDPTLALVMGGALAVTVPLFPFILRKPKPVLDDRFHVPANRSLDAKLALGAVLFGIGWGLGGFCPGPALASLATGSVDVMIFVVAMYAGFLLARGR